MTLKLSLVIDGNSGGAKKALDETAKSIETLGKAAGEVSKSTGAIGTDLAKAGDGAATLGKGLTEASKSGASAAPAIREAGNAAKEADGGFGTLSGSLVKVAAGFAAGLAVGVVTKGLELALTAGVNFANGILSDQPQIEAAMKGQAALIGKIKEAYGEANGAASSYGENSVNLLKYEQRRQNENNKKAFDAALPSPRDLDPAGKSNTLSFADDAGPFRALIDTYKKGFAEGKADAIAFRNEVAKIAEALPKDSPLLKVADDLLAKTKQAAELQAELARGQDLLAGLKGNADAAATALGGSADKYGALGAAAGGAAPNVEATASGIAKSGTAAGNANGPLQRYIDLMAKAAALGPTSVPSIGGNPNRGAVTPLLQPFAAGGYTGDGGKFDPRGIVHAGEFVVHAEATRRIGVGNLQALASGALPGFAAGGYAGGGLSGGYSETSAAAGGVSEVAATANDFSILRGSVKELLTAFSEGKTLMESLGGVVKTVSQKFLDLALTKLDNLLFTGATGGGGTGGLGGILNSIFGSIFGGGAGAFPAAPVPLGVGLYHGGGTVGSFASAFKSVSPSIFTGAKRMHSGGTVGGLSKGERPIIAMDGEEVGWPNDLARKYGGSGGGMTINNFNVQTPNPRAFAESKSTVARASGRFLGRAGRYS